ncbi:MAG: ornithine cyclodeaminase family protein [Gammaproteobacteria bacterium]
MNGQDSIPYLSDKDLSSLNITTHDVIECIEELIFSVEKKLAWTAPKAVILPDDGRYMMATLAAADGPNILAVKSLVLNPQNPARGLAQINGLVTLLDGKTGLPLAILDANWITAVRTAGLSATAAKYLANKESCVAAFVGCGVQATSHLQAFSDLFSLKQIKLFGRGAANIEKMCADAKRRSIDATVCDSGNEAISDADLIVSSVTYSGEMKPFLDAARLKPGAFAAVTDLAAPWHKSSFSALDQVVIDDLEQEEALPNKLLSLSDVTGDLSGLVRGQFSGRYSKHDRNAFVFRGHALGDLALAILAFQRMSPSIS